MNINSTKSNASIIGTSDDDFIMSGGFNVTVDADAGNDHIGVLNTVSGSVFLGWDGDDTIYIKIYAHPSSGSNISINADNDNDQISADCSNTIINYGSGDDSIRSYGTNVTIIGGAGNDTLRILVFSSGDSRNVLLLYKAKRICSLMYALSARIVLPLSLTPLRSSIAGSES